MKNKNYFWGLFFIGAAAVILINQLGYLGKINLFSLILTILFIPIIIKSIFSVNFGGVLFPLAFLAIIFDSQLGITSLTPWPILAIALFGTIGLSLIFKPFRFKHHHESFDQCINTNDSNNIDLGVSFGSCIKYVNSDDFETANISCSFGAMKIYFDNAKMKNKEALINLNISFSGVELYIPKDWKVSNEIDISLGGVEEKNKSNINSDKTIILKGKVNLSGVEIIYI